MKKHHLNINLANTLLMAVLVILCSGHCCCCFCSISSVPAASTATAFALSRQPQRPTLLQKKNSQRRQFVVLQESKAFCNNVTAEDAHDSRQTSDDEQKQHTKEDSDESASQIIDQPATSVSMSTTSSDKSFLLKTFLTILTSSILAAKFDFFVFRGYSDAMPLLYQDVAATLLCAIGAYGVVKFVTVSFQRNYISSKVARKLIHILTGPIFVCLWPLFSVADGARYFAASVTFLNALRLWREGNDSGDSNQASADGSTDTTTQKPSLAQAVSRSGDIQEALGGPFIYVCILQTLILLFWRNSVGSILAICNMAVGDGLADLVGRKFGKTNKWFFSKDKSMAGSLAFVLGAFASSMGIIKLFSMAGCLSIVIPSWSNVLITCIACAIVELIPIGDDNYTVPITGLLLGIFFFGM